MNLRDLQYLVAVSDTLHFGKAATQVNVSQPTLSMQLKKLEQTLGVQLFERSNKHVMLTPIGEDISTRARGVLEAANALVQAAQNAGDPLAGRLKLGLFPTLAPYLLPSLMPQLRGLFPALDIQLVEEKTPELLAQLEAGTLECALLALPLPAEHRALVTATLFTEPFLLAVAPDHPLAKRRSVKLTDLAKESVLLLEDGHCLRDQALAICQMIGVGEANHFRATSLETLRHMVAGGQTVTLMPALATRTTDQSARYIPFAAPAPSRQIGLVWRKTSARTILFSALSKFISNAYRSL